MNTTTTLGALTEIAASCRAGAAGDTEAAKSCCAAVYGVDLIGLFLGDSYHPGGVELTRRLADALNLDAGQQVLDIASGIGTTAVLVAAAHDVDVLGIDLGDSQVAKATARAATAGLADRLRFEVGTPNASRSSTLCSTRRSASAPSARSPTSPPPSRRWRACCDPAAVSGSPTSGSTRPPSTPTSPAPPTASPASPTPARSTTPARCSKPPASASTTSNVTTTRSAPVELVSNRLRALRLLDLPLLRSFDLRRAITSPAACT